MFPRRRAGIAIAAAACLAAASASPRIGAGGSPRLQTGARPAPALQAAAGQPAPPPTGRIAGRVTTAAGGVALADARILVTTLDPTRERVAVTAPDGRYVVADLPPDRYAVTASKAGFVTETFGDGEGDRASLVDLTGGQQRTTVDFALAREGVASGRILDDDGTPCEGARVEVLHPKSSQGQRVLAVIGRATTGDGGVFRVGGLRAGLHYVSAAGPACDTATSSSGPLPCGPTYHPGVTFPEEATPVRVEPGREVTGIEFRLRTVRPVSVTGRITAGDGRLLLAASVTMTPRHGENLSPVPVRDVTIRPDGTFMFRNVTPGRYVIRARGETERRGASLFGTFAASVGGDDLAGITIPLTTGAVAEGRLEFDGPKGLPLAGAPGLRVRAVSADGVAFGDTFSDPIEPEGRFRFRSIMPGDHVFRTEGLPDGWVLKGVYLHGRDVTDLPLTFGSGQRETNLQVVVSNVATTISGFVRGQDGSPRPDATVAAFAVDPARWEPYSRHVALARPALDASYRIEGLPPAEYWIVATKEVESGDLLDRMSLERLTARAQRVTLGIGVSKSLDLVIADEGSRSVTGPPGADSR